MIEIDGSFGEGGGQILRTALSLSCLFGKPFRIYNIRKGRAKPGLAPQHLVAVRAAQRLARAEVRGDDKGSTELSFSPRGVTGGEFEFDIGTAGSTILVLQTLIPALLFSGGKSRVTLSGGTHVPFSPSFHYLAGVFIPFLGRLGLQIRLQIEACGFYPRGGGQIRAEVGPTREVAPLQARERGSLVRLDGISAVGNLPLSIAERQKTALLEVLLTRLHQREAPVRIDLQAVSGPGQGTFLFLKGVFTGTVAGFTSLGALGKRAETVGEEVAQEFLAYHAAEGALDPHLPDQIVLYLALCPEASVFTTTCITSHLLTNLWAIGLFHEFRYRIDGELGGPGAVMINGPEQS
ncbi:MAG TPA: RNA 3'-terminal phosphate cyclase [Geobacteraceae bacterium]